ncbi:MAG: PDZ domain-containing protein [Actinomycetota bacterium]|nr:PDZ domain-containing protein [Actinomycetota bacterium]
MSEPPTNENTSSPRSASGNSRRTPIWAVAAVALISIGLLVVLGLDRVTITSKVLTSPGSTRDITPMLVLEDVMTYSTNGEIRMVTVKSNLEPSLLEMLGGWLDDSIEISDRHEILGDLTTEQNRTLGREQMAQSLDIAARVALERLGYEVISAAGALVVRVVPDTPASAVLDLGDVVIKAENKTVENARDLGDIVRSRSPGDSFSFSVLQLDGTTRDETVVLSEKDGNAFLGVAISTYVEMDELPFEINFLVERVGGPSAGLGLTLALLETMLPGELLAGLHIVATGTVDPLGNIGPVGGIAQKSHAVMRGGADLFVVPSVQVEQAQEILGETVDVVAVETLDDALRLLGSLGGDLTGIRVEHQ